MAHQHIMGYAVESVMKEERRLCWEGFAKQEDFKLEAKEWSYE